MGIQRASEWIQGLMIVVLNPQLLRHTKVLSVVVNMKGWWFGVLLLRGKSPHENTTLLTLTCFASAGLADLATSSSSKPFPLQQRVDGLSGYPCNTQTSPV